LFELYYSTYFRERVGEERERERGREGEEGERLRGKIQTERES